MITIRYPTLRMHVHDGQLFGLHGLDETGRCVDQVLTRELNAHRRIRFGAPTAKTIEARGYGQVDSSSNSSNRPACRGQRFALPTAQASAHLPTAFHHDYQDNLRLNSTAFLWKIQGDTRRTPGIGIRVVKFHETNGHRQRREAKLRIQAVSIASRKHEPAQTL